MGFGLELKSWRRVLENFILALMGLISKNPCLVFLFLFVLVSLICVDLSCEEVDP